MNKKNLALINRLMTAMRVAVGDALPPVEEDKMEIVKKRIYVPARDQHGRFSAGQGEWKEVDVKINPINDEFRRRKDCQPNYLVYWAAINEQGHIHHDTYAICHAALTRPVVKNPKFIINRLQWGFRSKDVAPRDTLEAYLEYLSYRSPYHKAFAIKGGKKILDDGYAVFNTNLPGNIMAAAMLSVRMMWEHPGVPFIWHELVRNGVHPDVAYVHAYQVTCKDFETLTTIGLQSHTPIGGCGFSKQFATNFVKHNPINAIKHNYNVYHAYSGMHNLFGSSKYTYYANESYLNEHLADIGRRALQKVDKKNINPFANAGEKKDAIPAKRFCELWAPILIENYKEILDAK